MENIIWLLINKMDFIFLLSEMKNQNKFNKFKKILDYRKIQQFLIHHKNQEKYQCPEIYLHKLKLILLDDEKILIPKLDCY